MSRNLLPLKNPGVKFRFATADIESVKWTRFLTIGYFDGTDFRHFESLRKFFDHAFSNQCIHIFAHFGGIFDFLFLLKAAISDSGYEIGSLIPRGSGILCFDLSRRSDGRVLHFHDSGALLPMSLKRITEAFKVTHSKKEIDYARISKVTPRLLEYLEYDCRGLYESLEKFYSDPLIEASGPKFTIASQAIQVLRTFLTEEVPACPRHIDPAIREAYAGGRTEIFKPLFQALPRGPELMAYDFNSLYPAVMAEADEMPTRFKNITRTGDLDETGFAEVTVTVPSSLYIPPLWVKNLNGKNKFIFPTGQVSGVYPTCELRRAVRAGCTVTKMRRFYRFANGGPFLRDFVRALYSIRQRAENPVSNAIAKLLLNSSYGRLAIGLSKESLSFDDGRPGVTPFLELKVGRHTTRLVKEVKPYNAFSNVAIGAWITALARIKLFDALTISEKTVHYCDTDSIYSTDTLPVSGELGCLKLESSTRSACFLLPKTYSTREGNKMKGFDKKKIQHFQVEDFQHALQGDFSVLKIEEGPRMNRFKSAVRAGDLLSMGRARSKQVRSLYDKRVLFQKPDGVWDSRPHHIE